MPQNRQQQVGKWGERVAASYLEKRGYQVLAHNVRTAYGEIDLIARPETGGLVFVEVKTRTSGRFGYPEEAVDARKLGHLVSSAQAYMDERPQEADQGWRIDVIAIQGRHGENIEEVSIVHFENIAT